MCREENLGGCLSSKQSMTSPQPSIDSLLSESVSSSSMTEISTAESDDVDHESTSSFGREDYNTVKRRNSKSTSEKYG